MIDALFLVLLLLALAGDARIFFFVANRIVFGGHREERSRWHWMLYAVPPLLLALTILFWPLHRWLRVLVANPLVDSFTPEPVESVVEAPLLARAGAAWLLLAAGVGLYWIIDRGRLQLRPVPQVRGTRTLPPRVVSMRKAHVPFAWLRRLGAHNDVYDLEITRHDVAVGALPRAFDGYRIAFLTDTHVAPFMRTGFYRAVVEQTAAFSPDLVLLGGDFVTWNRHIPLMAEVLFGGSGLHAPDGVYAVLGNHDYWAGAKDVAAALNGRGVQLLVNRLVPLRRGGEEIVLAGIDERYRGTPDLDAALGGTDDPRVRLGLSHHPDIVHLLERGGRRVDLLLCGHTHGGQIRFPLFGPVVVPSRHEAPYASGFHRVGGVLLYVSRGLGAVPPLRILCRPELATFVLRTAAALPPEEPARPSGPPGPASAEVPA